MQQALAQQPVAYALAVATYAESSVAHEVTVPEVSSRPRIQLYGPSLTAAQQRLAPAVRRANEDKMCAGPLLDQGP